MKIDLSKYPPGTRFQQRNKSKIPMILIGINPINHKYVITWKSPVTKNTYYQEYNQDGSLSEVGHLCPEHDLVELYPSDKYLVTYISINSEVCTHIIKDPSILNEEHLIAQLYYCKDIPYNKSPKKVLSWSKIEE